MLSPTIKGLMILFGITFLWGTSFPVIKIVMYDTSPFLYTGFRALVSTTIIIPLLLISVSRNGLDKESVRSGIMVGLIYSFGIFLQGWGTAYTSASNSAFLTSTSVIIVLVLESIILRKLDIQILTTGILSVVGVYLLTDNYSKFSIGDLLVLISAFFWALQIIMISYLCFNNYTQFVCTMLLVPTIFLIFPILNGELIVISINKILWIAYLGVVVGLFASFGQVIGQRVVSASVSAVIYQMEPIFAYLLSYGFLGEILTMKKGIGALLILLASVYASYYRVKKDTREW